MALFMDVGPEDAVQIGTDTFITVEKKSGRRVRMRIMSGAQVELLKKVNYPPQGVQNPPAVNTGD